MSKNEDLVGHSSVSPECLDAYADSALPVDCEWFRPFEKPQRNGSTGEFVTAERMVIPATIIVEKVDRVSRASWKADAFVLDGDSFEFREIYSSHNRTAVRKWISDNFGPVGLAR